MEPLAHVRLVGPRVVVRSTELGDAARYVRFFARNREHLRPWEPLRDESFFTEEFWRGRMIENEDIRERGAGLRFAIFEKPNEAEFAGTIGLMEIVRRDPLWSGRIGYSLDAGAQGRGLMSEAVELVVRHAFDTLHLRRLLAGYVPRNTRSAKVLERAGFIREGYYREALRVGGDWEDHIETTLINHAWREPHAD